jgi:hypothetical protein
MASDPPKALFSYSHDSAEYERRALAFANELCTFGGADAWIRRYCPDSDEWWISWMRKNIKRDDRILLVFTETHARRFLGPEAPGKGLGVTFERRNRQPTLLKAACTTPNSDAWSSRLALSAFFIRSFVRTLAPFDPSHA